MKGESFGSQAFTFFLVRFQMPLFEVFFLEFYLPVSATAKHNTIRPENAMVNTAFILYVAECMIALTAFFPSPSPSLLLYRAVVLAMTPSAKDHLPAPLSLSLSLSLSLFFSLSGIRIGEAFREK